MKGEVGCLFSSPTDTFKAAQISQLRQPPNKQTNHIRRNKFFITVLYKYCIRLSELMVKSLELLAPFITPLGLTLGSAGQLIDS